MKILAGILMSLYLGLTLFGLYQYKAHNRQWGMKLVVWLAALALLMGVGLQFSTSLMLGAVFGLAFSVAYFIGWRWLGDRFSGWRQHLVRGLLFAVFLGPLAAMRFSELDRLPLWLMLIPEASLADFLLFLLRGLPGFLLAGIPAFLISLGLKARKQNRRIFAAPRARLLYPVLVLIVILVVCMNWYIAGMFNIYKCLRGGGIEKTKYIVRSRPGSINLGDRWKHTPLFHATRWGEPEMILALIKIGAEVNARDRYGLPPLFYATNNQTRDILLEAGAEVSEGGYDFKYATPRSRKYCGGPPTLDTRTFKFDDGGWVHIQTHDTHSNDHMRDVSHAYASTGEEYISTHHFCCPAMMLLGNEKFKNLKDFLSWEYRTIKWVKVRPAKAAKNQ